MDAGGWNIFCTFWSGFDQANPAVSAFLRGPGASGTVGWPTSEKIEALRTQWLDAPDLAAQKKWTATLEALAAAPK